MIPSRLPQICLLLLFSISAACQEAEAQKQADEFVAEIKHALLESDEAKCKTGLNRLLKLEPLPEHAAPLLKQCLDSKFSSHVKIRASWGLARLKVDRDAQIQFVLSVAADEEAEDALRIDAVRLLVLLQEKSALQGILGGYSKCKSMIVREEILDLVRTQPLVDDKAKTTLLACIKEEPQLGLRALGILVLSDAAGDHEPARDFVLRLANDQDKTTRLAVALALGRFPAREDETRKTLRALLSDVSMDVRVAAAGSLARLGEVDAGSSKLLVDGLTNSNSKIRAFCLGVMHLLQVDEVEAKVAACAQDESDEVRAAAAEALKLLRTRQKK